jgi:sugar/nucleoside kinase (ribokinase family)
MNVLCVGLATRDTVYAVPEHPPADGRVVADELVVSGGGPAATAAVTLARLGVEVAFVGAVGDDDAGTFVRAGLAAEGVDVSALIVAPGGRTPQSTILVKPDGTRTIVHHAGDVSFAAVAGEADWVHVDHVGYGRVNGRVSVDAGNPIPGLDLGGIALYAPSEERLRADFGSAEAALAAGAEAVVVTRGDAGSYAVTAAGRIDVPAHPCEPVSTLGAGDVFHGALLAFLVRGAPLAEALRAANVAASLSCRALDGRSAIPTLEEVEWHIASQ